MPMYNYLFVTTLGVLLAGAYIWGFKTLPEERWQIICTVPLRKTETGSWQGLNLTYYGFFNAVALFAAVALVFVLTGAAGVDVGVLSVALVLLLGWCLPVSRLIARCVEKKRHAFSVGAASFLGIVAGPWLILLMEQAARHVWGITFSPMAVFSALMIGYALGEGIGRLACISFGCCYGRPMDGMPTLIRRYFSWAAFTYKGCTKKIAYAHRLEGKKIFAVQGVTAVLYSISALAGTLFFLQGDYAWAYFVCLLVTQAWRFISEFFRSDFRGDRKISVYQIMSLLTIPYGLLMPFVFPAAGRAPDIRNGLRILWDPAVILFLQIIWLIMFLRTGRSQVTGAGITFHVKEDQI